LKNKANYVRFWAKNEYQTEKQSQFRLPTAVSGVPFA
jgi:hypothetical protein